MDAAEPRPLTWLRAFGQKYPHAWKTLQEFRAMRGSKPELSWPNWVYVPVAGAYAVVSQGELLTPADPRTLDVSRVAALGAWRMTKGIYRYDPVLFEELWASEYEGPITLEPLRQLPEWAVYIETPGIAIWRGTAQLHGFFAFLEFDLNTHHNELYLVWDVDMENEGPALISTVLHLDHPTLEDSLRYGAEEGVLNVEKLSPELRRTLEKAHGAPLEELNERSTELNLEVAKHAVSLLLYLIASGDVRPAKSGQPEKPHRPQPIARKGKSKLVAAPGPRHWDVGVRFGNLLRGAYARSSTSSQAGSSKRPHVRRAHWHGYWMGPRSKPEERRLELRWLPPILVGASEDEELPSVIWRVRA